jgi:hypothetical protein
VSESDRSYIINAIKVLQSEIASLEANRCWGYLPQEMAVKVGQKKRLLEQAEEVLAKHS